MATSRDLERLADRLTNVERNLRAISSVPQLANSTIVDGAIDQIKLVDTGEVDENGYPVFAEEIVGRVGEQEDGSNGSVVFDGPIPPRPIGFAVTGGAGFIAVEWFGEFEDRFEPYLDHDYVAIHVGITPDFTPIADTLKGTIRAPQGESVTIGGLASGSYYVTLISVARSGRVSEPSPFDTGDANDPGGADPVWVAEVNAKLDDHESKLTQHRADIDAATAAANAAAQTAIAAQQAADAAVTSADGKTKIVYSQNHRSTAATAMPDLPIGAIWYQTNADGTVAAISELINKDAGGWGWNDRPFTDSVVTSITAGKITTGTLAAATTITTGDPNGTHTVLGQSSLQVWRPDGDGVPQPTISIGGADRDVLLITDPTTGATVAGFDGEGGGSAQTFYTNWLNVNGQSLGDPDQIDDILYPFPKGQRAVFQFPSGTYPTANTELGVGEVIWDMQPRRLYKVVFDGNILASTAGSLFRLFLRFSGGADPYSTAPTPTITSSQLTMGYFQNSAGGGHVRCHIEGFIGTGSTGREGRVLLSLQRITGGYPSMYWDGGSYLYVDDVGLYANAVGGTWNNDGQLNTGGGTPHTGSTSTPGSTVKKTYTKTYNASWSRNWRNGSVNDNEVRQGYYSARYYGAVGFPSQVQADLSGATITKMELYLYANHWYNNSGGTAVIGNHGSTSAPSSFPSGSATFNKSWSTKSGGQWVTIPSSWWTYWTTGAHRGFTLGDGASTSTSYYGRFNGVGMSYAPKLRVTYQK